MWTEEANTHVPYRNITRDDAAARMTRTQDTIMTEARYSRMEWHGVTYLKPLFSPSSFASPEAKQK